MHPILIDQHRRAAELLPQGAYDYYATGSGTEISLAEAPLVWQRYRFRPHVLRDVTTVDTSVALFGASAATPIFVAPTAFHGGAHPDGESATIRGTGDAGSLFVLSTRSSRRIEDVAQAATGPWWFQVYLLNDGDLTTKITARAVAAGAHALVLTVDTPFPATKSQTAELATTDDEFLVNLAGHLAPNADVPHATFQSPAATLDTLRELAEFGVPVLVKGVLRADDALACLEAGAAGIVVSNHGGRQLDQAIDTATALTEVAAAVGERAPVLVDGGIRTGRDVLVALALGASAVFVGRPALWALAADGAAGVTTMVKALTGEFAEALALAGIPRIADATGDLVLRP